MLTHYLATAVRLLWKRKTFSVINLAGLAIGISASLVIFLIVYYEISYDKYQPDRDRIYHVVLNGQSHDMITHAASVPAPLYKAVPREISGIEATVPFFYFQGDGTAKVSIPGKEEAHTATYKNQPDIVFADDGYLSLLGSQWLAGSNHAALQGAFSVVLRESRARAYFPHTALNSIIGKSITYNDSLRTTVTGIVKDNYHATNFPAKEFISLPTVEATGLKNDFMMNVWDDWMSYSQLYLKLKPGIAAAVVEKQLNSLLLKYNPHAHQDATNYYELHLQPLSEVHFDTNYAGFAIKVADKPILYGLLGVAAFLLLLAAINFVNLTTAQAALRAREIGVRKTMGSSRKNLVLQFLGETLLLTTLAAVLALILAPFLLHAFADFIPQGLSVNIIRQPGILLFLVLLIVAVTLLAGFYPALILSAYQPARVLSSQSLTTPGQTRSSSLRKILTVTQFVIAQFFVICTLLVGKQIHYTLNKDLGFAKEAILTFDIPRRDTVPQRRVRLLQQLQNLPGIQRASIGFLTPATAGAAFTNISYPGRDMKDAEPVQIRWGDSGYLGLYRIPIIAGRNVAQSDTVKELVINEYYARSLGFKKPEQAVNHFLLYNGVLRPIVGVMADFNAYTLHSPIAPIVFTSANKSSSTFHIALQPHNSPGADWPGTIRGIQKLYESMYPDGDFSYTFFDETIASFYKTEQNTSQLLRWAMGLTILLSCMGMLGLVLYTTHTRTREIGVRKVFGASVTQIVTLLSKDFVLLVLLAFAIAAPIAWYALYKWLQHFSYRTGLSWWMFALSGIIMLATALVTLSFQTFRAAAVKPVKSLRAQ